MPTFKTTNNWFTRLGSFFGGSLAPKRAKPTAKRLRLEQLESRRVFAAILLDVPGINGDATVQGATATDMELQSFQWGFARTENGARASLSDPIQFNDLTFKRTTDSASNDLYAQTALQSLSATPTRLRVVESGVNLLRLDLSDSRLTNFTTSEGQQESGALSFSNLGFTENVLATPQNAGTPRIASWNLLSGAASSSAIVGQSNIDSGPSSNPLGIETVMQIGTEKMRIDGFKWEAQLDVDMSLANPLSGLAKGSNFQITRGVDSATAGLLGSAAGGTIFPEIKISDRSLVAGKNLVTMEWRLYDAFFAGFNLEATANTGSPKNGLELAYGRIELIVNQYNSSGVLAGTETTTWNEAGNIVTATNDFGIANPLLVDNSSNLVISSLNFGVPVGSPAGTPNLGRLEYESMEWSVSRAASHSGGSNSSGPTKLGAMTVALPTGKIAPAPALLGQLANRSQLTAVNAFEKDTLAPTTALDTFGLTNVIITGFSVKNVGLEDTEVKFAMDFRSFTETFTDRTTPATPLVTRAGFNVQTQSSTITPNFGGKTFAENDTNVLFVLAITEAGVTSEIPVQSAAWSVSRSATIVGDDIEISNPAQSTFNIEVPRGVHSPGLLAAAVRGTQIDSVSVLRYEVVDVAGEPTKQELYRWDLNNLFITEVGMHMRPGNSSNEVDTISLLPRFVSLETPNPDPAGVPFRTELDFSTNTGEGGDDSVNDLAAGNPALRYKLDGVDQGIAIDSYQWGATLPVDNATSSGTRPLGNPSPNNLLLTASRIPSPKLLNAAFSDGAKPQAIVLPTSATALQQGYDLNLNGLLDGFSYSDEITAVSPLTNISIFIGGGTNEALLRVTPINSNGTVGTSREVTWNLQNDTTTNFSGFGNFQFANSALPATTLEIAGSSQLAVDSYTFGIDNALSQFVGTSTAAVPLAARGNPSARTFNVITSMDRATPGLLNAIATKSPIPQIKITERRTINGQFLPWREWVLTNVFVETLANKGTESDPQGEVRLELNAASATSRFITYNAAGTPTTIDKRLNFADVPSQVPLTISALSTDADRVITIASRFTEPQFSYTTTVVSGANLFDGVSLNAQNQLVLNFKPGQRGTGQIRIDATNAFALGSSLLVNVNLDDGIVDAPAGTDQTVSFNEDTQTIIRTANFGFTDPNDFPANTLAGVRIASLPARGSLLLNNVPVTAGQTIPVANLNANQLRYRPDPNGQGANYASFTFQVQDSAATSNLDLTPNRITFDVFNTNDAPTFTRTTIATLVVTEDATSPAGILVSQIANTIRDIDPGALFGVAVVDAPTTLGTWQYTLDGSTWQSLTGSSTSFARLLAADATTRVRFLPNANANGPSTLRLHAWDRVRGQAGGIGNFTEFAQFRTFSTASASLGVNVLPVNDAPTISAPNVAAVTLGTPLVFSTASANAITIADIDAAAETVQITISASSGQFTLSTLTGLTIIAGSNGSSALSARGTLAAINNALADSTFSAGGTGSALLQLVFNDLGNTGGGVLTSSRTIELSVSLPSGTVDLGALTPAAPTVRRSGNRDGSTSTPDLYAFSIGATSDVRLNLSGLTDDLDLRVFDAGGQQIGQSLFFSTTIENILLTALPAGTYLAAVGRSIASAYDLTISTNTNSDDLITQASLLSSPNATTLPTVRQSTVSSSADLQDYFRFELTTASALRINLSGLSQDMDIQLLDSAGRVIQAAGVSGNSFENMLTSTLAVGTYYLRVFAFGAQLTSNYDLTISTNTASDDLLSNATSLGLLSNVGSVRRTGNVAVGTDLQDYYAFAGGNDIAISVSGLTSDVDVQILDLFGRVLAQSTNSSNTAEAININIPPGSGSIYVRIFAFAGASSYVFEARNNANVANADDLLSTATPLPDPLTSLTRTGAVGGTGSSGDPQDYYRFQLNSVRNISLSLTGLSADLDIEVLDQFGNRLFVSQNGGAANESINIAGLGIGLYFIRIYPFNAVSSNYNLSLTVS